MCMPWPAATMSRSDYQDFADGMVVHRDTDVPRARQDAPAGSQWHGSLLVHSHRALEMSASRLPTLPHLATLSSTMGGATVGMRRRARSQDRTQAYASHHVDIQGLATLCALRPRTARSTSSRQNRSPRLAPDPGAIRSRCLRSRLCTSLGGTTCTQCSHARPARANAWIRTSCRRAAQLRGTPAASLRAVPRLVSSPCEMLPRPRRYVECTVWRHSFRGPT